MAKNIKEKKVQVAATCSVTIALAPLVVDSSGVTYRCPDKACAERMKSQFWNSRVRWGVYAGFPEVALTQHFADRNSALVHISNLFGPEAKELLT